MGRFLSTLIFIASFCISASAQVDSASEIEEIIVNADYR